MALEEPLFDADLESRSNLTSKFDLWNEVKRQLTIAGPMILVTVLNFAVPTASVMFVGHLGKLPLASASLANSSCNVSGFIVIMGMSAALETLCGQAYGAKQYQLVGIYLQRAIFYLLLLSMPISVLWFYMENVLLAMGQDPTISAHSGEYARFLIPALFASVFSWPLVKFLQSQYIVAPMAYFSFLTALVHVLLCWTFLYKLKIGAKGAAISASISMWINSLLLLSYVLFSSKCKLTYRGISRNALHDCKGFFKLAIPATVMICLEAWSFEVLTLLSGLLPNPQLETSAFSSVMVTLETFYMIPLGLSAAASTRAANELGAGNSLIAKSAVGVTVTMGMIDSIIVVTLFLSFRDIVGWAFSNNADVVEHIANLIKVAIFIFAFDPIQGVLTGVCRGCGWQALGALANLLAFYVVGLPIAIILAFVVKLHGKGLWIGIACGNASQTMILCLIVLFMNWENQAKNAKTRICQSLMKNEMP